MFSIVVSGPFKHRRLGSGRPCNTDARQDRRIVLAAVVTRTASGDGIRHMLHLLYHQRTIGNHLLTAGLRSRVLLVMLPLAPRHRQARLLCCRESVDWRVEWRSVVFSDESTLSLYVSDGHTRVDVDLASAIFWSAFDQYT